MIWRFWPKHGDWHGFLAQDFSTRIRVLQAIDRDYDRIIIRLGVLSLVTARADARSRVRDSAHDNDRCQAYDIYRDLALGLSNRSD